MSLIKEHLLEVETSQRLYEELELFLEENEELFGTLSYGKNGATEKRAEGESKGKE